MFVVARTDADDVDEIARRAIAFAEAGADAILIDAIQDFDFIRTLKSQVDKPLVFNQITGGKSPSCTLKELRDAGVSIVIYSTPCLFSAQVAIEDAMKSMKENDGLLQDTGNGHVDVWGCTTLLNENLARRDRK